MKLQPANMLEWQPSLQVSVVMGDDEQAIRQRTQEDKQYEIEFKEEHSRYLSRLHQYN